MRKCTYQIDFTSLLRIKLSDHSLIDRLILNFMKYLDSIPQFFCKMLLFSLLELTGANATHDWCSHMRKISDCEWLVIISYQMSGDVLSIYFVISFSSEILLHLGKYVKLRWESGSGRQSILYPSILLSSSQFSTLPLLKSYIQRRLPHSVWERERDKSNERQFRARVAHLTSVRCQCCLVSSFRENNNRRWISFRKIPKVIERVTSPTNAS